MTRLMGIGLSTAVLVASSSLAGGTASGATAAGLTWASLSDRVADLFNSAFLFRWGCRQEGRRCVSSVIMP